MKKIWSLLILVSITLCIFSVFVEAASLRIHFLDAGEGDSILIQTPQGKTMLVDAGNLTTGSKVARYLKSHDICALDHLIFTHPHPDHIGGALPILQIMNVGQIYDNGEDLAAMLNSSEVYRSYEELVRGRDDYAILKASDTLLEDGVVVEVLWPPRPPIFSDWNANSLVLMIKHGEFKCLLAGDLTTLGEKELLKEGKRLKANVLKVGHHGSCHASSKEFLKAVSPKISIISVNEKNIQGYLSEEVVKTLKALGSKVYRTDMEGDIIIDVEQDGTIQYL